MRTRGVLFLHQPSAGGEGGEGRTRSPACDWSNPIDDLSRDNTDFWDFYLLFIIIYCQCAPAWPISLMPSEGPLRQGALLRELSYHALFNQIIQNLINFKCQMIIVQRERSSIFPTDGSAIVNSTALNWQRSKCPSFSTNCEKW